ncbi:MAG: hypothetical protein NTX45_25380, partial [Proteobacteria bacterium]|nr:hypothetical protein [Pseudomonadota bacterium]
MPERKVKFYINAVRRNSVLAYCAEWPTLLLRRNTVEYRRFRHTALGYDQSDRALAVRYPNQLVAYTWQNGAGLAEVVEVVDSAKQRVFAHWHS